MTTTTISREHSDAHGNPTSGDTAAVELYDRAVDSLLRFHPDVIGAMEAMVTEHPDTPMGHALWAELCLMSTDTVDLGQARASLEQLRTLRLNDREAAHASAIERWAGGDWYGAAAGFDEVLQRWPADMLALAVGHQLDFFVGDRTNLRDRVARSLVAVDPAMGHVGFMHGMHAFGLEECGDYEAAEEAGTAAVDANPDDVWAIHAVAHAHEMRGRVNDGIDFMDARRADWGDGHLFTVHLWWHYALYLLEAGRGREVLDIYDGYVHNAASDGVPIEMLDAASLLWRLRVDGVDDGGRFAPLADAWESRAATDPWYVFNDVHAVMAMCGAGRRDDAVAAVDRIALSLSETSPPGDGRPTPSNDLMTAEVGLPVARALVAYADGRYGDVVDELMPVRARVHRFGGSHAQRDVVQRTLVDAAVRARRPEEAEVLLAERLQVRPSSMFDVSRAARLLQ